MIQDRIGPNRAVLKLRKFELRVAGLLHTAADGVKFFFKEDFMPPNADKLLFSLAPILAMTPVLALLAVIPFGDTLCIGDFGKIVAARFGAPRRYRTGTAPGPIDLMVAPLNVGLLYVFALAGQGIVGAAIAGWSSDNKFSLMGALRAASQMVSYEVAMGLSLIGAMMIYGTIRLDDMVRWQGDNAWGIFVQPLAFFLFFTAAVAENKRIPFDLPEAESELVSGYFTEYSGMKFGMFYFAEYMEVVHELDAARDDLPRRLAAAVLSPRRPHHRVRRRRRSAQAPMAHWGSSFSASSRSSARRSSCARSRPSFAGASRASATTS